MGKFLINSCPNHYIQSHPRASFSCGWSWIAIYLVMESLVHAKTCLHNLMLRRLCTALGRASLSSRIRQVESWNLQYFMETKCCGTVHYGHISCRENAFVRPRTGHLGSHIGWAGSTWRQARGSRFKRFALNKQPYCFRHHSRVWHSPHIWA